MNKTKRKIMLFQRVVSIIGLMSLTSSCASMFYPKETPYKGDAFKNHINKEFFVASQLFDSKESKYGDYPKPKVHEKCSKLKIVKVNVQRTEYGDTWNVYLENDKEKFKDYLTTSSNSDDGLTEIIAKRYFDKIPFDNRKIKIDGKAISAKERVCKGQIFTGMKKEELLFVLGEPSKINASGGRYGVTEQWVYRGSGKASYYYFKGKNKKNISLASWQY